MHEDLCIHSASSSVVPLAVEDFFPDAISRYSFSTFMMTSSGPPLNKRVTILCSVLPDVLQDCAHNIKQLLQFLHRGSKVPVFAVKLYKQGKWQNSGKAINGWFTIQGRDKSVGLLCGENDNNLGFQKDKGRFSCKQIFCRSHSLAFSLLLLQ